MELLSILLGFTSAGFFGFLLAWATGQLVAGSKLSATEELLRAAQETNTKLIETNDTLKGIVDSQAETLREAAMNTQIANRIAEALAQYTQGHQPSGGVHQ